MGNSSTKAKRKYNRKAYKRTELSLKPYVMDFLNSYCNKIGNSKNGFILKAIEEKIKHDTGKTIEELLKETEQSKDESN